MAKKSELVATPGSILEDVQKRTAEAQPPARAKTLASVVQFYKGVELMGSRQTYNAKHGEIEVTPIGVKITSKKTGTTVLVPWTNVTGCQLL